MEDFLFGVVAVLIVISFPVIGYTKKCILNYSLYVKVGWIIAPYRARNLNSRSMTLEDNIIFIQQDLEIPMEFRLDLRNNKAELKHTKEILEFFKQYISEQYFGGYLSNTQKIRNLHDDWYFMYSLFVFSDEYSKYDNTKLRDKIYKYESTDGSYRTHSLTDFGRVFYKIYLISLLYVENNKYTRKLYKYIDPKLKEHLKSYLNSNKITFWSYRP